MTCPKCGHEQADGWLSCQQCHIIFSRWKGDPVAPPAAAQAGRPPSPPSDPAAAEPSRPVTLFGDRAPEPPRPAGPAAAPVVKAPRPAGWWVYLALLLPFAAGLWWLTHPRGMAVVPGSFIDSQQRFAIHAPEGWLTLTRENFDAIVRQYGSQFPSQFTQALSDSSVAVSFVRLGPLNEFAPSLNVVVVQRALPPINEKSKQEAADAIAAGFRAVLAEYEQESVRIIEVDGLRSLEIVSSAASPFRLPTTPEGETLYLRYRQVVVPGKKMGFIVTSTVDMDAEDASEEDF
jgi:hypothetical protein